MSTKSERAEFAKEHTVEMESKYTNEIKASILNSEVRDYTYTDVDASDLGRYETDIFLTAQGTLECARLCNDNNINNDKIAILDFASYKNPGGNFMGGSIAQDEMICAGSNLYNILSSDKIMKQFYEYNRNNLNTGAYSNRHVYVSDVIIDDSNVNSAFTVDVINCAAPNKIYALRYRKSLIPVIDAAMQSRIDQVLYTAYKHNVNVIVLGAFGCGVFKNNPDFVAKTFIELLETKYKGIFSKVVFGIPDATSKNYLAFAKYISKVV